MKYLVNLDLTQNQLQNAVIQPLATAPVSGVLGQVYYNSVDLALYQYNGTAWKKVGVVYNQAADDGVVVAGLDSNGNVATAQVVDLVLDGYTPVEEGVVGNGDTLEEALYALDNKLKDVITQGGEPNQEAWSYVQIGSDIISATEKKDTLKVSGSGAVNVSANDSTKTVTIGITVDSSLSATSTNPAQNKIIKSAIDAKYTKPSSGIPKTDLDTTVQTSLGKADTAVQPNALGDYLKKDGSVAMTGALAMGTHKITGLAEGAANTDAATVGQMNTAIGEAVDDYLPLGGGTMTGAISMGGNAINGIPNASADTQPVAYGQLPGNVVSNFELDYNGDTVTIEKSYKNIKTGSTSSDDEVIALANGTTAGLMSPASVNAISNLTNRVEALEGTTVRLLYSAKTNPTASEVEAFVRAEGYTDPSKWPGIAVVVADTYHIWHYYSNNTTWKDDGVDTVSQFTNNSPGIIRGSQTDGKVYAEDDGTGSVYGWDTLKARVSNVENNKADKSVVNAIPVVKTATGTIATSAKTVSVSYSGTVLSTFVKDGSGNKVITDVVIGASSVNFTCAQNPSTALICVVIYI